MLQARGLELGRYFNADDIAKGLDGPPEETSRKAQELVRAGRAEALEGGVSHSFETVMSHHSHIDYMLQARARGFTVRLFFVATDKPEINLQRVANRVAHGGHNVPADRIVARYHRCLENLLAALLASDEALIFDNSQAENPLRLLASVEYFRFRHVGAVIDEYPAWWLSILSRIESADFFKSGPNP